MRSTTLAALSMTTALVLSACAGEEPAPMPPPPPPPPPVASVTAPADTTPPPPAKPPLGELIRASMKTMGEGFGEHDAVKMASVVTDDVAAFDYGGGELHSKGELTESFKQLFATFGDAKSAVTRIWVKGNVVISEIAWSGTMTGDMMGMKATGKPVGEMRLHIYWFNDDGLVKEMHEYADSAGMLAQMQGKKGAPPVPVLPTNPPEFHMAKDADDGAALVSFAKSTDAAFDKDDAKAVGAVLADDADYWLNFTGMPASHGKKQLVKELDGFFHAFPDQKWTETNVWGIDGFAIVEHSMAGTFKGPFGPVRPTGKPVTAWHQLDIMQPSADGKIQHGWGYMNVLEMMAQSGALPKPGDKPAAQGPKTQAKTPPKK